MRQLIIYIVHQSSRLGIRVLLLGQNHIVRQPRNIPDLVDCGQCTVESGLGQASRTVRRCCNRILPKCQSICHADPVALDPVQDLLLCMVYHIDSHSLLRNRLCLRPHGKLTTDGSRRQRRGKQNCRHLSFPHTLFLQKRLYSICTFLFYHPYRKKQPVFFTGQKFLPPAKTNYLWKHSCRL